MKYLVNIKNKPIQKDFRHLALRAYKDLDMLRQMRIFEHNTLSIKTTTASIPNYVYDTCTSRGTKEDFLKTVIDQYWNLLLKNIYYYHSSEVTSNIRWGIERFKTNFHFPKETFDNMTNDFMSLHTKVYDFVFKNF